MEGLHWVLQYYHNGVSSWNWFYPSFYACLASDMVSLRSLKVSFRRGRPFSPLTQLMAVLPPESAHFLPQPMKSLMIDPHSPVADFYPPDFDVDMNGKRNDWEAIIIVPFINEQRLLQHVAAIDADSALTREEKERDVTGSDAWFRAADYPQMDKTVKPVRPSKFSAPKRSRSRSRSNSPHSRYGGGGSRYNNSGNRENGSYASNERSNRNSQAVPRRSNSDRSKSNQQQQNRSSQQHARNNNNVRRSSQNQQSSGNSSPGRRTRKNAGAGESTQRQSQSQNENRNRASKPVVNDEGGEPSIDTSA